MNAFKAKLMAIAVGISLAFGSAAHSTPVDMTAFESCMKTATEQTLKHNDGIFKRSIEKNKKLTNHTVASIYRSAFLDLSIGQLRCAQNLPPEIVLELVDYHKQQDQFSKLNYDIVMSIPEMDLLQLSDSEMKDFMIKANSIMTP